MYSLTERNANFFKSKKPLIFAGLLAKWRERQLILGGSSLKCSKKSANFQATILNFLKTREHRFFYCKYDTLRQLIQ
jgi:hypothetical protein